MDLFNSPDFIARVERLREKWHVPGLAIAVFQDDTTASRGFGQASIQPPKPCTADTLFDIASSSKSLTAASVGLLVADNTQHPDIQWDAVMSRLLPDDFAMSGEGYTETVTVEDALSHRTGLPSHDSSYLGIRATRPDTARSVTRNLRHLPVAAPPRTKFMYCNQMYTVASHLVEVASGQRFAEFLHSRFFAPLGMSSTHLQPDAARAAGLGDRIATPYVWREETRAYAPLAYEQCPEAQGAGSVITSANDYIRWVRAVMNRSAPISEEIYRGLIRPRIFIDPDPDPDPDEAEDAAEPFTSWTAYAAGWEPRYYRGHAVVQHDGLIAGFGSTHFFLPGHGFGGVVLGNALGAGELAPLLARELIDHVLGVPPAERVDWDALYTRKAAAEEGKRERGDAVAALRARLAPDAVGDASSPPPQKIPLRAYTGEYWNAGYHGLTVGTKDGGLFVDAADRSMGFSLTFEHVADQSRYIAHLVDYYEGGDEPLEAEFRFENDRVVKLGLALEPDLEGLIWFDRVDGTAETSDWVEEREAGPE